MKMLSPKDLDRVHELLATAQRSLGAAEAVLMKAWRSRSVRWEVSFAKRCAFSALTELLTKRRGGAFRLPPTRKAARLLRMRRDGKDEP